MVTNVGATLYRWQCQKCGDTVPGVPGKYLNFCGHHPKKKGCAVHLIDETGKVVALSKVDADRKGLFNITSKPEPDQTVPPEMEKEKEEEDKDTTKPPRSGQPLLQGFFKTQFVELDIKVLQYHQIFMDEGLIPINTKIGHFILGAIETLLEVTGRKLALVQRKKGE